MKATFLSAIVSLALIPAASAQEYWPSYEDEVMQGRMNRSEFLMSPPSDDSSRPPCTDRDTATPARTTRRGPLKSVLRGVASTVYHASVIGGTAAVLTVDALSSANPTGYYTAGSFVPNSTYGVDSCVHGYATAGCPYGSNGSSYGSMYLSGPGTTRCRPDYTGGYRYYTATGNYGTIRPTYSGGYRVTPASPGSYRATSAQGIRYGGTSARYRGW